MTGIHRLQHIQTFSSPDLANDNTVRPHPQRSADQVADGDLAPPLRVSIPGLQGDQVRNRNDLQLCRILHRNDPLLRRDELR